MSHTDTTPRKHTAAKWIIGGTGSIVAVIIAASVAGGGSTTTGTAAPLPTALPPTISAQPVPAVPAAPPAEAPAPAGPANTFGDGSYDVGTDILPGRYHTQGVTGGMGYVQIKDKDGNIVDTVFVKGPSYVALKKGQTATSLSAGEWELQKAQGK